MDSLELFFGDQQEKEYKFVCIRIPCEWKSPPLCSIEDFDGKRFLLLFTSNFESYRLGEFIAFD